MIGKKNMVFGFFYFILTLGLGMYLSKKLGSGPEWAASQQRGILRAAHAHGNLEALLNVVVGYFLCRMAIEPWISRTVSVILIIGALLHSGILYLGGVGFSAGFKLSSVGAVLILVSMLLMGIGIARLKEVA